MKRIAFILLWLAASPALANHPGDRLDEVMAEKEPAFEATDVRDLPDLDLLTAEEEKLRLDDFSDQIVVLSFVPDDCADPCAAQQAKLEKVREDLEVTPMREMVTFVTVRPVQGLPAEADAPNRRVVAPRSGSVVDLADAFAALSNRDDGAPLVHVIDRAGRHAAILHGSAFVSLNMILYINGLTNAPPQPDPGFVDRVLDIFW